ncbi:MAG: type II CAAX prenyl endopeptidase Rce1 family protein [Nitrospirota bacterium]
MNRKTLSGYCIVLALSSLLHALSPAKTSIHLILPLFLLFYPTVTGYRVKISLSPKDIMFGLAVSVLILAPYGIAFRAEPGDLTPYLIVFQFLGVAFPEEFFFRGFLQDSLGRNYKAVVFASLLFALAHLPQAIFSGGWIALLSFFPSLIMGWLFLKTKNILPGAIFHWVANLIQQSIPG